MIPRQAFSLPDQDGSTRSLTDFSGKWLVLYFYPKDDTPGCAEQACVFRDDWHKLTAMGAEVVGVSVDDVASHSTFAMKYSLPFPLLADAGGEVAARYGSIRDLFTTRLASIAPAEGCARWNEINIRPMCAVQDSFKHWTAARRRIDYPIRECPVRRKATAAQGR